MTNFYLIKRNDKTIDRGYSFTAIIETDCHSKKFFNQFGFSSSDPGYYNLGLYAFKRGGGLRTLNGFRRKKFTKNKIKSLLCSGHWTIIGKNLNSFIKISEPKILQNFQLPDEIIKSL